MKSFILGLALFLIISTPAYADHSFTATNVSYSTITNTLTFDSSGVTIPPLGVISVGLVSGATEAYHSYGYVDWANHQSVVLEADSGLLPVSDEANYQIRIYFDGGGFGDNYYSQSILGSVLKGGENNMTPVVMDATVKSAGTAIITDLTTNLLAVVPGVIQVALPWIIGIAVLIFIVKFGRAMIGH
jgi:hypothetical protein